MPQILHKYVLNERIDKWTNKGRHTHDKEQNHFFSKRNELSQKARFKILSWRQDRLDKSTEQNGNEEEMKELVNGLEVQRGIIDKCCNEVVEH